MILKVGITGGIGTGKSTICKIFSILGIPIYNADFEAKKLYNTDETIKQSLIQHFGNQLYTTEGFNKEALRNIVFKDQEKLNLLNSIVHPRIKKHANQWMESQKSPYVLKEAALMIESESYKQVDKLIVVTSPLELRIKRAMCRDGATIQEIQSRIDHQLPADSLLKYAHFVIENDEIHSLISQVMQVHSELLAIAQSCK